MQLYDLFLCIMMESLNQLMKDIKMEIVVRYYIIIKKFDEITYNCAIIMVIHTQFAIVITFLI